MWPVMLFTLFIGGFYNFFANGSYVFLLAITILMTLLFIIFRLPLKEGKRFEKDHGRKPTIEDLDTPVERPSISAP